MTSSKIGRIADPHLAFWHVAGFLSTHENYRKVPLSQARILQQAIAANRYVCLGDGKTVEAVVTWQDIDLQELSSRYSNVPSSSDSVGRVFLSSLAAANATGLKMMVEHLRTIFADKDVYWDRHKGRLGYRPAKTKT